MKQLPSVCLWKRSVRRFVLLLSVPLVFGVSPSTFAASAGLSTSSPPSQEILLQQQQELEGELEDVNKRLEEIRQQLRELQRIPVTHQTDEQRQTQAALQEEE
ncbi:MAG: hypothetical protein KC592_06715, partial [Nitrospira sp.]|nr:hypothetical protein [Nitrospira sp.]